MPQDEPAQSTTPSPALFKSTMRNLAGAVSVITAGSGDERTGFTATSVVSLSADGPTVLVIVNRNSSSWTAVEHFGRFCINFIADGQESVAQAFSGFNGLKGVERYDGADWHQMEHGGFALEGALASLDCELEEAIPHRSHVILVGIVKGIRTYDDAKPLLYWRGSYHHIKG